MINFAKVLFIIPTVVLDHVMGSHSGPNTISLVHHQALLAAGQSMKWNYIISSIGTCIRGKVFTYFGNQFQQHPKKLAPFRVMYEIMMEL